MADSSLILREKRALRLRMKAWRASLSAADRTEAARAVANEACAFLATATGASRSAIVSGFASMPEELSVWPLMRQLHGEGFRLALPVVEGKGLALLFRAWAPGDEMGKGVWDIPQPKPDKPAIEPDILLVPLLAFDRQGWRLGYGGGFYDRTLSRLRARKSITAAGLAFDAQQVDAVPHLDYDQRLDWVITPSGPIRCSE